VADQFESVTNGQ